MARKNDQIFQLSLTEIAFTIAFILLVVLGAQLVKEDRARQALQQTVDEQGSVADAQSAIVEAQTALKAALESSGVANVDEVISSLIANQRELIQQEQKRLELVDLDERISALAELRSELSDVGVLSGMQDAKERVELALMLQKKVLEPIEGRQSPAPNEIDAAVEGVRKAIEVDRVVRLALLDDLGTTLVEGKEERVIRQITADALRGRKIDQRLAANGDRIREISDLKGQVTFLRKRLDARGGRDFPPCWADATTGKVQPLLSLDVQDASIAVAKAWPSSRDDDAALLPSIPSIVQLGFVSHDEFGPAVSELYAHAQKNECRHYVLLKSSISDAVRSDRARLMVENFFYKIEVRR